MKKQPNYEIKLKPYCIKCRSKSFLPDDTVSRDAIALVANEEYCCIQLFQIRAGKLVGRLGFFADAKAGTPGAILQRALEEHYITVEAIEIPTKLSFNTNYQKEKF